jgi:hypothetical protein
MGLIEYTIELLADPGTRQGVVAVASGVLGLGRTALDSIVDPGENQGGLLGKGYTLGAILAPAGMGAGNGQVSGTQIAGSAVSEWGIDLATATAAYYTGRYAIPFGFSMMNSMLLGKETLRD